MDIRIFAQILSWMTDIKTHYSLEKYNTFGLKSTARYFAAPRNNEELITCIQYAKQKDLPFFILGGGSNILLPEQLNRVVLYPEMDSIQVMHETDQHIEVQVSAGVNWDYFVAYCVKNNWQGLENLSLIPGNVGASPIQNIGAYGVEVMNFITRVSAIRISDQAILEFTNEECRFSYRNSIFKNELKDKVVITSVNFLLNKNPQYHISYQPLQEIFQDQKNITAQAIRDAVIHIRQSKLPDPKETGNAGSFFKNPIVTKTQFRFLKDMYPHLPHYETSEGIKIPAAWLLEKAGWKGVRDGAVGCHGAQPLVIVNYGEATYRQIQIFTDKIIKDIKYAFNIKLEKEVNIITNP